METLGEHLTFRKFIMPQALQLLFWAGIGGVLYGSWFGIPTEEVGLFNHTKARFGPPAFEAASL
ncbi:MAG: DUF2141 domain-containing protein [Porticoccaceae bacterium]|nr:DUF2141 domain-containing protein [Porticoccaceae bacterium]